MSDAELISRLRKADEYEPLGHDGWDAADRIEALEAKLAKAVEVIEWALISWDDHNKHGYNMQVEMLIAAEDFRAALAEIKGESHE